MSYQICREAEAAIFHRALYDDLKNAKTLTDATETTCIASVSASFKVNAAAIISFSTSGRYVFWICLKRYFFDVAIGMNASVQKSVQFTVA